MSALRLIAFSSAVCFLLWPKLTLSAHGYRIAVNNAYADQVGTEQVSAFFQRMYAPLGVEPSIRFFPSKRGLQLANDGVVDAESGRVLRIASQYPDLIPVPEPMINHKLAYFCLNKQRCERSRELVYGLVSGFRAGIAFCQEQNLHCLTDQSQSFLGKALAKGTVDAILGGNANTLSLLCKHDIKTVYVRPETGLKVISYHLVHKRHAHHVEALAASIRDMRESGFIDDFVAKTSSLREGCDLQIVEL